MSSVGLGDSLKPRLDSLRKDGQEHDQVNPDDFVGDSDRQQQIHLKMNAKSNTILRQRQIAIGIF